MLQHLWVENLLRYSRWLFEYIVFDVCFLKGLLEMNCLTNRLVDSFLSALLMQIEVIICPFRRVFSTFTQNYRIYVDFTKATPKIHQNQLFSHTLERDLFFSFIFEFMIMFLIISDIFSHFLKSLVDKITKFPKSFFKKFLFILKCLYDQ